MNFWTKMTVVALLSGAFGAGCAGPGEGPAKPNVVLLVIDTLRRDRLSSYGYAHETSPFLDELAAAGTRFASAYSASSWTSPAMAALMTSTYPFQNGVVLNLHAINVMRTNSVEIDLNRIPGEAETLPEMMKRAGYRTFGIADNINVGEAIGFDAGFDRFRTENYVGADSMAAFARSWKADIAGTGAAGRAGGGDDRDDTRPFFFYLHFMDPHAPYHRKQPWFDRFVDERDDLTKEDVTEGVALAPGRPNPLLEVAYDSEIRALDEALRTLFDEFGWHENTLVVVASDHGEEFWEHGRIGHSHSLYEELIRVPLIVYGPDCGVPGGRVIGGDASVLDIVPTLAERVGVEPHAKTQGRSLWGAVRSGRDLGDRSLYAHLVRRRGEHQEGYDLTLYAVIDPEYKFLHSSRGERKLFDRRDDPGEQQNLAFAKKDEVVARSAIVADLKQAGMLFAAESTAVTLDSAEIEHLRALGYVD